MALHILDLPSEILSIILSHVPCRDLVSNVPLVCRQFCDLLSSEWYWRRRFVGLTASQPLIDSLDLKQWQRGCVQYEWAGAEQKICLLTGSVGGLDCVHLLHPSLYGTDAVIAAGSRDSNVYLWRRRSGEGEGEGTRTMRTFTSQSLSGHKGWVWSLASEHGRASQVLCSGAWDHTVCVWDVGVGKNIASVKKQHNSAILSLNMPQPNLLITTSYDKHVREIDLRQPITVRVVHKQHTKPVLSVWGSDRYIYSGSEDKCVCVWDRRGQGELQKIKLKGIVPSIHLDSDLLTVACNGVVNVYDAKNGTLDEISSFSPDHPLALTSVLHNLGTIVTGSKDGAVKIHSATRDHDCIATLDHHNSAITGLDFSRKTLAIASSDRTVSLCTPLF